MAKTKSKHIFGCIVTGLLGSVLFCGPAVWAEPRPMVTDALAHAHDAGLSEPLISHVLATVYDAGFDPASAARTLTVLAEARQKGYELQPFRDRIDEGIAKRIDGARIARALEERLERLIQVSERLPDGRDMDASTYQTAVASLADGLEMGLTLAELDALLQQSDDAPLAMTAVAAEMRALLKQLAFAPDLADQIIAEGLAQQSLNPAWRHFPQIVVIARQKGVPDEETGGEALKRLQAGGGPADLLTRLGFTGRNLRTGPLGKD